MRLKYTIFFSLLFIVSLAQNSNAESSDGSTEYDSGGYYEGEFSDGKRHGMGVYELPNGYKYIGEWVNGEIFGHGVAHYPNGSRYEGTFSEGKPD